MADIILNKPEAGTQAVFEAAGDSRIDLNFPTDQAIRPIPRTPCPTS